MRCSVDNPPDNVLGKGINEEALTSAINVAGYPLQSIVARKLMAHVSVTEEWGYIDADTREHRSLDVFGFKTLLTKEDSGFLSCHAALLVECKKSRAPFVFFQRVADRAIPDFPRIAGVQGGDVTISSGTSSTRASPAHCIGLNLHPFIAERPARCAAFGRAELNGEKVQLSGEQAYKSVVLPLLKAVQYAEGLYTATSETSYVNLIFAIAVLDAPMLLVESPESASDPIACPWIRIVRQAPRVDSSRGWYRWDALDVVHIGYLDTYLREQLNPFLADYASRVQEMRDVLRSGAQTEDIRSWTWTQLKPKTSRK